MPISLELTYRLPLFFFCHRFVAVEAPPVTADRPPPLRCFITFHILIFQLRQKAGNLLVDNAADIVRLNVSSF